MEINVVDGEKIILEGYKPIGKFIL